MSTAPTAEAPATAGSVLVVDDEQDLAAMIAAYLQRAQFEVSQARTGPQAITVARDVDPDVVILDLGLPGLDGVEVCRQLRRFTDCYVLMLTARSDEVDKVVGLSVGADDYITKPFSPRELVARVQAVLRRPRHPATTGSPETADGEQPTVLGRLVVDPRGRRVMLAGRPLALTRTEFDILELLVGSPLTVFTRRRIIDEVWDPAWVGDEHVVDVHVAHLRRKLGNDTGAASVIETVRGVGFRMATQ